MKKLVTVLLALAMAFTMVFATAASAEDGYKDSITWVIGNDQDILDPQNNVSNSKVMPQYYNGLLGYDNDGNVVCKIAESYEASEDKMTWTFHLRQDVYFHSGRHCTAHDFEATLLEKATKIFVIPPQVFPQSIEPCTAFIVSGYRGDNAERINVAHFVDVDGAVDTTAYIIIGRNDIGNL